jgi:hypothetical protein
MHRSGCDPGPPVAGAVEYNCFVQECELITTPGDTKEYPTLDTIQQVGA